MITEDPPKIKGFLKCDRDKSRIEAVERNGNVHASHLGTIPDLTFDRMAQQKQNNRIILLKCLSNIRYLGKDCLFCCL